MTKKIIIICIGLIGLLSITLHFALFNPVKVAIKEEDLKSKKQYILVQEQKSTVSQWVAIGDENGLFDKEIDVRIKGNTPSGYNYDLQCGNNTFVCYGKFTGLVDAPAGTYQQFDATDWDILYPVKRSSLFNFIIPKTSICKIDTVNDGLF